MAKGLRGMGGWLGILVPTHADDEACRHGWGCRTVLVMGRRKIMGWPPAASFEPTSQNRDVGHPAAFVVRKVLAVWVSRAVPGSFDCGAHGEAVSTFAQDDRVLGV